MKVLFDGRSLLRPEMGGVPKVAAGLLPALTKALQPDETLVATTGLQYGTPNKLVAALTFFGLSSYERFFRNAKPDALFLPNLEFVGRPSIPYFLLVHDLSFLIEPRWFSTKARLWHWGVQAKRLMHEATHLFAMSQCTKQDLMDLCGIDEQRISVIPMGLERTEPTNETNGSKYILCLGAGNRRKNAGCVIAAHRELIKDPKFADVKLVLLGGPGSRPSDSELAGLMRDASIFCYPSWYEGFGLPLHEAAIFGTPCISSTAGVLPETAPEGTSFASPAKPHHWAEALRQTLENPVSHRTKTTLSGWKPAAHQIAEIIQKTLK